MHYTYPRLIDNYTSIENIHKLIDPLFLDSLKAEFAEIEAIAVERTRKMKVEAFQRKLAGLQFLEIRTRSLIQFNVA